MPHLTDHFTHQQGKLAGWLLSGLQQDRPRQMPGGQSGPSLHLPQARQFVRTQQGKPHQARQLHRPRAIARVVIAAVLPDPEEKDADQAAVLVNRDDQPGRPSRQQIVGRHRRARGGPLRPVAAVKHHGISGEQAKQGLVDDTPARTTRHVGKLPVKPEEIRAGSSQHIPPHPAHLSLQPGPRIETLQQGRGDRSRHNAGRHRSSRRRRRLPSGDGPRRENPRDRQLVQNGQEGSKPARTFLVRKVGTGATGKLRLFVRTAARLPHEHRRARRQSLRQGLLPHRIKHNHGHHPRPPATRNFVQPQPKGLPPGAALPRP